MLEVVKQQQELLLTEIGFQEFQQRSISGLAKSESAGNARNNQVRIANGCQRYKPDAIDKRIHQLRSYLNAQAGFADATGTEQRK